MKQLTLAPRKILSLLLVLAVSALTLKAEIIFYEFDDPVLEQRFNVLIQELRCPKCQNNNLADSNAPLSVDLKDIIYEQLNKGASDDEIISYLKARYGDFIYYKPPVKPSTWFIWFGPFALLLVGSFLVIRFLRTRSTTQNSADDNTENDSKDASMKLVEQWQSEAGDND